MNEHKIRLIADQATQWCRQNAHGAPTAWEWEYKFAELIAEECAKISEENFQHGAAGAREIRTHFGIK